MVTHYPYVLEHVFPKKRGILLKKITIHLSHAGNLISISNTGAKFKFSVLHVIAGEIHYLMHVKPLELCLARNTQNRCQTWPLTQDYWTRLKIMINLGT